MSVTVDKTSVMLSDKDRELIDWALGVLSSDYNEAPADEIAELRQRIERSATYRCRCTHEAGDTWPCDAHPGCSECGAETTENVKQCEKCLRAHLDSGAGKGG